MLSVVERFLKYMQIPNIFTCLCYFERLSVAAYRRNGWIWISFIKQPLLVMNSSHECFICAR